MGSRLYEEGYNESLLRAVAALNETPASTEAILGLLQKHWDLPRGEAEQLLSQERYEGFFQRNFARYLTMPLLFRRKSKGIYDKPHKPSGSAKNRKAVGYRVQQALSPDRKAEASNKGEGSPIFRNRGVKQFSLHAATSHRLTHTTGAARPPLAAAQEGCLRCCQGFHYAQSQAATRQ